MLGTQPNLSDSASWRCLYGSYERLACCSTSVSGQGLRSRTGWRHRRLTPDSCRLAATPSAASGQPLTHSTEQTPCTACGYAPGPPAARADPYMGLRESRSGFEARDLLSSFLAVSLFGLRSGPFRRPGPLGERAGARRVGQGRALVLDGPEHTGRLGNASARRRTTNLGIGLFISGGKRPLNPYIRRDSPSSPIPYPTCWEVRGRAGRDQSYGRH
jgi:hypothetical protein